MSVAIDPSDLEGGLSNEALEQQYLARGDGTTSGATSSKASLDAITAKKRKAAGSASSTTTASGAGAAAAAAAGAGAKKKQYKSDFKF